MACANSEEKSQADGNSSNPNLIRAQKNDIMGYIDNINQYIQMAEAKFEPKLYQTIRIEQSKLKFLNKNIQKLDCEIRSAENKVIKEDILKTC